MGSFVYLHVRGKSYKMKMKNSILSLMEYECWATLEAPFHPHQRYITSNVALSLIHGCVTWRAGCRRGSRGSCRPPVIWSCQCGDPGHGDCRSLGHGLQATLVVEKECLVNKTSKFLGNPSKSVENSTQGFDPPSEKVWNLKKNLGGTHPKRLKKHALQWLQIAWNAFYVINPAPWLLTWWFV